MSPVEVSRRDCVTDPRPVGGVARTRSPVLHVCGDSEVVCFLVGH